MEDCNLDENIYVNKSNKLEYLHVITPVSNYVRFKRRYELFRKFKENIEKCPNIILYVVEVAFGTRTFKCTESNNPRHLQLRTNSEIWHKENMINLMAERLPTEAKYIAWVDADIIFINNKTIGLDTIHALQHYDIVQMFQTVVNLGPNNEVLSTYKSFMYQYLSGKPYHPSGSYEFWHPGFCYACRRESFSKMGTLIDFAILGSADHHMALSLIGKANISLPGHITKSYRNKVLDFEKRCERNIKRNVGYVNGTIIHYFHGKFSNRKYKERWQILIDNKYDPDADIAKDYQGLYHLDTDKFKLRDDIRAYFRQRNEDCISLD